LRPYLEKPFTKTEGEERREGKKKKKKKAGEGGLAVTGVVEHLSSKHEALSLNPSTTKNTKGWEGASSRPRLYRTQVLREFRG
jgi:hypothetical protein